MMPPVRVCTIAFPDFGLPNFEFKNSVQELPPPPEKMKALAFALLLANALVSADIGVDTPPSLLSIRANLSSGIRAEEGLTIAAEGNNEEAGELSFSKATTDDGTPKFAYVWRYTE